MKKPMLILSLLAVFALLAIAQTPSVFSQFTATNGVGTAQRWVSTNLNAYKVTMIGLRSEGVSNSAATYVGPGTNSTPYVIFPGERHIIEAQPGTRINLKDWWLKTPTSADAMIVIYE